MFDSKMKDKPQGPQVWMVTKGVKEGIIDNYYLSPDNSHNIRSKTWNNTNSKSTIPSLHNPPSFDALVMKKSLHEYLNTINIEITILRKSILKKSRKLTPLSSSWLSSFFCGTSNTQSVYPGHTTLERCFDMLSLAQDQSGLSILMEHENYVSTLLHMNNSCPMSLSPEEYATTFVSLPTLLSNNNVFFLLHSQTESLHRLLHYRQEALNKTKEDGKDVDRKGALTRLIEASSWYRLVHRYDEIHKANVSDGAAVEEPNQNQVQCILTVMEGEDFYSEYYQGMKRSDWWEIAQAAFENIVLDPETVFGKKIELECIRRLEEIPFLFSTCKNAGDVFDRLRKRDNKASSTAICDWMNEIQDQIRTKFQLPVHLSKKGLSSFVHRALFPRISIACFQPTSVHEDLHTKDRFWRHAQQILKKQAMTNARITPELEQHMHNELPYTTNEDGAHVFFQEAIDTFSKMTSIVPCDLLNEFMHGILVLHEEAARVIGTEKLSVETFFPILTYVLLFAQLDHVHSQLYLLEHFAIGDVNANGERGYYVYCLSACLESLCQTDSDDDTASISETVSDISQEEEVKE